MRIKTPKLRRVFRNILLGLCLLVLFTWLTQLLIWEYIDKDISRDPFFWKRGELQQRGSLLLGIVTIIILSAMGAMNGWRRRRWALTNVRKSRTFRSITLPSPLFL